MGIRVEAYDDVNSRSEPRWSRITIISARPSAAAWPRWPRLAGYGLVCWNWETERPTVVIRDSAISYRDRCAERSARSAGDRRSGSHPVQGTVSSEREKGGSALAVTVEEDGLACVEFSGTFVAIR